MSEDLIQCLRCNRLMPIAAWQGPPTGCPHCKAEDTKFAPTSQVERNAEVPEPGQTNEPPSSTEREANVRELLKCARENMMMCRTIASLNCLIMAIEFLIGEGSVTNAFPQANAGGCPVASTKDREPSSPSADKEK